MGICKIRPPPAGNRCQRSEVLHVFFPYRELNQQQNLEYVMNVKSVSFLSASVICVALCSGAAMAQEVPDHPRVNEVNQRLDNQQARIDQGLKNGTMTGKQAARDEQHDANIAKRESVDEAKHNGHLTKGEQNRLNRSENKNSRAIYRQKHSK